jgi:hypothetical protein
MGEEGGLERQPNLSTKRDALHNEIEPDLFCADPFCARLPPHRSTQAVHPMIFGERHVSGCTASTDTAMPLFQAASDCDSVPESFVVRLARQC